MKALQKLTHCFTLCMIALGLASNLHASDAKAVKVVGTVEVLLPGQTKAVPVTADMAIPEGSTITTSNSGQLFLETAPGVVATIQKESTVLVEKLEIKKQGDKVISQEAMLDLKKGSLVSTLDPTKKSINHYGVRTPKGVAAARGTVYGVSVNISGTSVATLSGTVTLNLGNNVFVSIPVGSGVINSADTVTSLASAIAASGQQGLSVSTLLQEAVQVVAANVAANTSAAGGAATATSVMAAVVGAAASADPSNAASFTQTAVAAVTASGSATGTSPANAINAVTEAAVRAAPGQSAAIAQSAAAAVVETKVTEAVNAAKASGGDTAAAAAAAQTEAAAVVTTVAQTVVNAAAASGTTVSTESVTTAVNNGSTQGTTTASTNTNTTVSTPAPSVPAPAAPSPSAPIPSAPIVTPPTPIDLPPVSPSSPKG